LLKDAPVIELLAVMSIGQERINTSNTCRSSTRVYYKECIKTTWINQRGFHQVDLIYVVIFFEGINPKQKQYYQIFSNNIADDFVVSTKFKTVSSKMFPIAVSVKLRMNF